MHQRQAIRTAMVSQLLRKTLAGERVFPTRNAPWRRIDLPGVAVYAMEETASEGRRKLKLAVLLVVALDDQVDAALDDLAAEVEAAIGADPSLGRTVLGAATYAGMTAEIAEEQGLAVGAMRLTYEASYPDLARSMSATI